jgi:hypothetical protein
MKRSTKRKWLKYVIVTAISFVLIAGGIAYLDHLTLRLASSSNCASDQMYGWRHILDNYQKDHAGKLPPSLEAAAQEYGHITWLNCSASEKPYRYFPEGIDIEKGKVVVACPHKSHGLITKFSFGIAYDSDRWYLVRIDAQGKANIKSNITPIRKS